MGLAGLLRELPEVKSANFLFSCSGISSQNTRKPKCTQLGTRPGHRGFLEKVRCWPTLLPRGHALFTALSATAFLVPFHSDPGRSKAWS